MSLIIYADALHVQVLGQLQLGTVLLHGEDFGGRQVPTDPQPSPCACTAGATSTAGATLCVCHMRAGGAGRFERHKHDTNQMYRGDQVGRFRELRREYRRLPARWPARIAQLQPEPNGCRLQGVCRRDKLLPFVRAERSQPLPCQRPAHRAVDRPVWWLW